MPRFYSPQSAVLNDGQVVVEGYEKYYNDVVELLKEPEYQPFLITNDTEFTQLKSKRATINTCKNLIDTYRKNVKKEKLSLFEEQCKSIFNLLDERQKEMGIEINAYAEKRKETQEKKVEEVTKISYKTAIIKYHQDSKFEDELKKLCEFYGCELNISK